MAELEFREAIRDALAEELEHDERVIFFGEDVAAAGGVFATTPGLAERFGPERVFDTPISELALAGAAFGSAVCGLRPVIEIMFGDFLPLVMDSLVNQASKFFYISNEQASVPLVVRSAIGAGGRFGAIHSQSPVSWFNGVPGLKLVAPSTPSDAKALLKAAIRDENPVLFLEHKRLYSLKEEGTGHGAQGTEIGSASVRRDGSDVTLVSCMKGFFLPMGSMPRSSTFGRCGRSIGMRLVSRSPRPTGWRRLRRARGREVGRARCWRLPPRSRCTTSMTCGASPRLSIRSPIARRSRMRSCPAPS